MDFGEIRQRAVTVEPLPAPPVDLLSNGEVIALAERLFPTQHDAAADWLLQQYHRRKLREQEEPRRASLRRRLHRFRRARGL
jgi:hypothetical protein